MERIAGMAGVVGKKWWIMHPRRVACLLGLWCMSLTFGATGAPRHDATATAAGVLHVATEGVFRHQVPGAKARTPTRLEVLLVQSSELVQSPDAGAYARGISLGQALPHLRNGTLDAWLGQDAAHVALPAHMTWRSLRWSVSPMAIMRTDTDIGEWPALRGRTVCVVEDGGFVGELARRYGASEKIYPSPTDALLALRTGQCDATVQGEGFLGALLRFPEWKKFSASLRPYRNATLGLVTRDDLPAAGRRALAAVASPAHITAVAQRQARDIAFEVYLDQAVPDCH